MNISVLPLIAAFSAITIASSAIADTNTLYVLQANPLGDATGNTLFVDQTAASNSLVAGDPAGSTPARQIGSGNVGTITVEGQDIAVLFSQTGAAGTTNGGTNNTGSVTATGSALIAALSQAGIDNSAAITVTGTDALGSVSQIGNGNQAALTVDGTDIRGELIQTGNRNTADLTVDGTGSDVSYQIIGDNLTTVDVGPSVTTNAGTVIIRQTLIGSN